MFAMKRKPPVADASDWMAPFKVPGVRVKLNAGVMDMTAVQGMIAESDNPALASDTFWKVTNAAGMISRDGARQKGTRKPRRPQINEWIAKKLKANPAAKSPELWSGAPGWITDDIGFERFSKRVTEVRKTVASK